MKLLMVHNRYLQRGGEDESYDQEVKLLRSHGIEVLEYIEDNRKIVDLGRFQSSLRTIWSHETFNKICQIIRKDGIDLVHVQNFFPLVSPSVFYAASNCKTPLVLTIRNYRLACLNGYFFRDNNTCESCLGKNIAWPGIIHKCYRSSLSASIVVASMLTTHRLLRTWTSKINIFITLSQFSNDKLIEMGLPADKLVIKPNFLLPDPGVDGEKENYAMFAGRLSPEKGVFHLLEAWKAINSKIPLKIVGDGPIEEEVQSYASQIDGVELLGRRSMEEVLKLLGKARFLVFPSIWYEGMPRIIIEAYAKGTPVIASRLGTMESMVTQETGLHFTPGNSEDLREKVLYFLDNPDLEVGLRSGARREYEQKYSAEFNFQRQLEIYRQAVKFG